MLVRIFAIELQRTYSARSRKRSMTLSDIREVSRRVNMPLSVA